jgi:FMN phosphatase YigB (HAD superfamily)
VSVTGVVQMTFLVDVDNTLLDNDRFRIDVEQHFVSAYGEEVAARYWAIQERRFVDLSYRDYLGATQEWWEEEGRDPRLLDAARVVLDYPFAERLYPCALDVLARLRSVGPTVILTDGDAVFQTRKVERSGIARAVGGHVLVYVHKELELGDVELRYPSESYVLVDDKPRILAAAKRFWGERVTTVLPLQGQFANDQQALTSHPAADRPVAAIADVLDLDL